LCPFNVHIPNIPEFCEQNGKKWKPEMIHQVNATQGIKKLIEVVKENSQPLLLNYHNGKWFFVLSEPQISHLNIRHTGVGDFGMIDHFLREAMEKNFLDLELSSIDFSGNQRF
jgi:hypothetical protein